MSNLKEDTLGAIENSKHTISDIDYCYIKNVAAYDTNFILCKGPLNLVSIDIEYDDGYGGQEIEGFIVFKDGTWLERGEYDGSEWWEYKEKPTLKEED